MMKAANFLAQEAAAFRGTPSPEAMKAKAEELGGKLVWGDTVLLPNQEAVDKFSEWMDDYRIKATMDFLHASE